MKKEPKVITVFHYGEEGNELEVFMHDTLEEAEEAVVEFCAEAYPALDISSMDDIRAIEYDDYDDDDEDNYDEDKPVIAVDFFYGEKGQLARA